MATKQGSGNKQQPFNKKTGKYEKQDTAPVNL